MNQQCPACGANLSRIDVDETGRCPSCGLTFVDEKPAQAPESAPSEIQPAPWFLRTVLIIIFIAFGVLAMGLAFFFGECARSFGSN